MRHASGLKDFKRRLIIVKACIFSFLKLYNKALIRTRRDCNFSKRKCQHVLHENRLHMIRLCPLCPPATCQRRPAAPAVDSPSPQPGLTALFARAVSSLPSALPGKAPRSFQGCPDSQVHPLAQASCLPVSGSPQAASSHLIASPSQLSLLSPNTSSFSDLFTA